MNWLVNINIENDIIQYDKTNNTKLEKIHGRTIPNIFLRSIYLDMFFFLR